MTHVFNDPENFTDEALEGYLALHPDVVRGVTGGVVRAQLPAEPHVGLVVGGGSGHYPLYVGYVGQGMATAAVVGNIYTSPSASYAYAVAKAVERGRGIVYSFGNYAGDVMNFAIAAEQLQAEGVDVRIVIVTDDVASAPPERASERRGIAGLYTVQKLMGAAADAGCSLDDVERIGRRANDRTRTIGIGFAGCTFPGASEPLFHVPAGRMAFGLGAHGEPGISEHDLLPASQMAQMLVDRLLVEAPEGADGRVAVVVNSLGATKQEELFVLWRSLAPLLADHGLTAVRPEVGEFLTSLDAAGVSLTLTWLDDELEELWLAPVRTSAFQRGAVTEPEAADETARSMSGSEDEEVEQGSESSRAQAGALVDVLREVQSALHLAQDELAALDSVAGDGDHGRGMSKGVDAAVAAAQQAAEAGAGLRTTLAKAGHAWATLAGGTSGILWGSGLTAAAARLSDVETAGPEHYRDAVETFVETVQRLGKAEVGDKTLVDAAVPYAAALEDLAAREFASVLDTAAGAAEQAARETAGLRPLRGRARPLAEQSVGTPDPGAVSFALVTRTLATQLA